MYKVQKINTENIYVLKKIKHICKNETVKKTVKDCIE